MPGQHTTCAAALHVAADVQKIFRRPCRVSPPGCELWRDGGRRRVVYPRQGPPSAGRPIRRTLVTPLDHNQLTPVSGGRGVDELGRDCTDPRIGVPKPPSHPLPTGSLALR